MCVSHEFVYMFMKEYSRVQKSMSALLEQELQEVVSHHGATGNQVGFF